MIIIVEGIDGTGKTYFCKYIAKKYGFKYIHAPKPKKPFDEFAKTVTAKYKKLIKDNLKKYVIFDRSFYSEYAYNYNRTHKYIEQFEKLLNVNYTVILFTLSHLGIRRTFNKYIANHQAFDNQNKFARKVAVQQRYIYILGKSRLASKYIINIPDTLDKLGTGYKKAQNTALRIIEHII